MGIAKKCFYQVPAASVFPIFPEVPGDSQYRLEPLFVFIALCRKKQRVHEVKK